MPVPLFMQEDGEDNERDYYRVLDDTGRLLWIFRDLGAASADAPDYYVHGLFG